MKALSCAKNVKISLVGTVAPAKDITKLIVHQENISSRLSRNSQANGEIFSRLFKEVVIHKQKTIL